MMVGLNTFKKDQSLFLYVNNFLNNKTVIAKYLPIIIQIGHSLCLRFI